MTILVLFHTMHFRDLKSFYLGYVCQHMRKEFPHTVSYNRFVERQAQVSLHLLLFLQTCALGKCTGISSTEADLLPKPYVELTFYYTPCPFVQVVVVVVSLLSCFI